MDFVTKPPGIKLCSVPPELFLFVHKFLWVFRDVMWLHTSITSNLRLFNSSSVALIASSTSSAVSRRCMASSRIDFYMEILRGYIIYFILLSRIRGQVRTLIFANRPVTNTWNKLARGISFPKPLAHNTRKKKEFILSVQPQQQDKTFSHMNIRHYWFLHSLS